MIHVLRLLGILLAVLSAAVAVAAEEPPAALIEARAALEQGRTARAVELASAVLKAEPRRTEALLLRAQAEAGRRGYDAALVDYNALLQINPNAAEVYYWRGRTHFCLGKVATSLADFNKFLELRPAARAQLWEHGIALYYAGKYEEGAKQFASYQTYYANDVENATWRYLCMSRTVGVERARAELLPIENDRRVPMMQVYALYRGKAQPADVLAAATADTPLPDALNRQLFYAHLYLGLYYEAQGDKEQTTAHLKKAVQHKIGHYMWDVARVHLELMKK